MQKPDWDSAQVEIINKTEVYILISTSVYLYQYLYPVIFYGISVVDEKPQTTSNKKTDSILQGLVCVRTEAMLQINIILT